LPKGAEVLKAGKLQITLTLAFVFLLVAGWVSPLYAAIDAYQFANPEQQLRFQEFTKSMRCPKCQNQNLADSDSPIAADLRRVLHELVGQEKSDAEIVDFMVSRYGEFVLYKPKVETNTWLLWFGPGMILLLGFFIISRFVRKSSASSSITTTAEDVNDLSADELNRLNQLLSESDKQ